MIARKMHLAALLVICVAGFAAPALGEACHLSRIAQVPMSIDVTGRINVPMTVAGKELNMLIDTGAILTELTQSTVDTLGLHPQLLNQRIEFRGVGGYRIDHFVNAPDIVFGGLKAYKMPFLVQPDDAQMTRDVDGILGPDILRAYDDDFDFANSMFSLFDAVECEGNHVWWTNDPHAEIPFTIDATGHIMIDVNLDGKTIKAVLDTGASNSMLDLDIAQDKFAFDDKDPKLEKRPAGTKSGFAYKYPFKALSFGGETENNVTVLNPVLELMKHDDIAVHDIRVLVGINILRRLHLYISYKNRMIYVTPASAH